jgi:hypothetical protein
VRRLPINHTLIDTLTIQPPAYAPPAAHHLRCMQHVDSDGQVAGQFAEDPLAAFAHVRPRAQQVVCLCLVEGHLVCLVI